MNKDTFEEWTIKKQSKTYCYSLVFDWCNLVHKKCAFSICPEKIKGSHRLIDTHGKTVKKL